MCVCFCVDPLKLYECLKKVLIFAFFLLKCFPPFRLQFSPLMRSMEFPRGIFGNSGACTHFGHPCKGTIFEANLFTDNPKSQKPQDESLSPRFIAIDPRRRSRSFGLANSLPCLAVGVPRQQPCFDLTGPPDGTGPNDVMRCDTLPLLRAEMHCHAPYVSCAPFQVFFRPKCFESKKPPQF